MNNQPQLVFEADDKQLMIDAKAGTWSLITREGAVRGAEIGWSEYKPLPGSESFAESFTNVLRGASPVDCREDYADSIGDATKVVVGHDLQQFHVTCTWLLYKEVPWMSLQVELETKRALPNPKFLAVAQGDAQEVTWQTEGQSGMPDTNSLLLIRMSRQDGFDLGCDLMRCRFVVNSRDLANGTTGLTSFDPNEELPGKNGDWGAWWGLAGDPETGKSAFVGFTHPVHHRTRHGFTGDRFEAGCQVDREIEEGETFSSDRLLVRFGTDPHEVLESFGDLFTARDGKATQPRPFDWNSWDYYLATFEEDDMVENLEAVGSLPWLDSKTRHFAADMGWATDFGDHRPNGRFRRGMKDMAERIRDAGHVPGIWVSPFLVKWFTRAGAYMPHMMLYYPDGRPGLIHTGPFDFLVDPTHPDGERFIGNIFDELMECGFRYYKIDFIRYLLMQPMYFHKNTMARMDIVRRGIEIIREHIGNSHFVGCGCQPEAAVGLVDAFRIGGDISTYHSTAHLQAQFLSVRWWMNRRVWINDPDFLIVRDDVTANDDPHNPFFPKLPYDPFGNRSGEPWKTIGEPRIWATLVALSGGAVTMSDRISKLNEHGLELYRGVLENQSVFEARPMDFLANTPATIWTREDPEKGVSIGIVNWEDTDQVRKLTADDLGIELAHMKPFEDYWTGQSFSVKDDVLEIPVPGRDARLLNLVEA